MSEFVKTMRDWKRLCDSMDKKYSDDCCKNCPLDEFACGGVYEMPENTDWQLLQEKVATWAAENPEPQYPTWAEWFHISFLVWRQAKFPYRANDEKAWFDFLHENLIPANIAEKLGLKPKGGENDV